MISGGAGRGRMAHLSAVMSRVRLEPQSVKIGSVGINGIQLTLKRLVSKNSI